LATLQQVDEHRRALLRSVSHELRTPLGIVHGAAAELVDEGDRYSPAERDRLLELLVDETGRLERIVANLLAMSRIDADAWEPSRELVDLGEIVIGAVRRLGPSARASRVAIEVEPALPLVLADPVQLDLVVTNLLENAVRHTDSGERIWVEASGHDRRVQLAVTDQGRGMSAELARRAFEPFVAGPGSTTTGIGLALCRAIVTAHGGTIHLEPGRAGKGTRAVVELAAG
jgi:two-component system sensor histidine kinase KdpD